MQTIRGDNYTESATVTGKRCLLYGFVIETDGANNGVVTIYDGNPGTRVVKVTCKGADLSYGLILRSPIRINNLLRFTLSGTGATVDVLWARYVE